MIQKIGSLSHMGGPLLVDRVLTNSTTVRVGDSVRTVNGFATVAAAGTPVLGHVESLIGRDGLTPIKDGTFLGNIGNIFVSTATNQTVEQVRVRVDASPDALYSAALNAAIGTTTGNGGSGAAGKNFNLHDPRTLAESVFTELPFTLAAGTPNIVTFFQYHSHGINPARTTNLIVNVRFSEIFGT